MTCKPFITPGGGQASAVPGRLVHRLGPGPAPALLLAQGQVWRTTADGEEKRCPRCAEWWPADFEFFSRDQRQRHGLSSWCRACILEDQTRVRRLKANPQGQPTRPQSARHPGAGLENVTQSRRYWRGALDEFTRATGSTRNGNEQ